MSADLPSMNRRQLLAATAGLSTSLLAGCFGAPTEDSPGTDEPAAAGDDPGQSAAGQAPTWPQFGHDLGNTGHAPETSGPLSEPELAWRYGPGTPTLNSSPVVVDDTVYVAGSGDPGYIHAVDVATGNSEWQFEPAGYATSAPAVVGDTLYVGTFGKQFYALDTASGEVRWERDIGHRFGTSSPAVADGTVYVGTIGDGPLVVRGDEDEEEFESCAFLALDASTGDLEWQYREFGERENVESSPAVADGRVFFGGETALYALDADSGEVVWTREVAIHPESSPAVVDGVVYYGGPTLNQDSQPAQVWALDAATGETVWTAPVDDPSLRTSPAVADGTVYVAASQRRVCAGVGGSDESECSGVTRGRLYAIDASSGEREWWAEIETDTRSSPAVADGVVYVGCRDGLSAVTTDGENAWRVEFTNQSDRDSLYVKSSPAVVDDTVFVGASDGYLRSLSTAG